MFKYVCDFFSQHFFKNTYAYKSVIYKICKHKWKFTNNAKYCNVLNFLLFFSIYAVHMYIYKNQ